MIPIIELLGYAAALLLSYRLLLLALGTVYSKVLARPLDVKKLGEWALVTGSTDGIGKAYAMALAKKGMNIVLVSRSPYKLQNVAAEIESKYKVRVKLVDIDFTEDEKSYVPKLEKEIQGLEIGVLVNNVGMSYEHPEEFLSLDEDVARKLVAVNITSMNCVTRMVMPGMVERRRGAVVNLSSMSCLLRLPLYSLYAATKAYVDTFTTDLELEYRRKGVTVQCVMPGYVVSNMSKLKKPSLIAPTPEVFVRSALARLGIESRTTGYWSHTLMVNAVNALPNFISDKFVGDQLWAIRAKALKRKAKEQ